MPSLPIPPGYIADILCTAKRCYELRTAPLFRIEKLYWGAQWLGIMIAPNSTSFFLDETIMYHNVVLSKIICPSSCSTSRICFLQCFAAARYSIRFFDGCWVLTRISSSDFPDATSASKLTRFCSRSPKWSIYCNHPPGLSTCWRALE